MRPRHAEPTLAEPGFLRFAGDHGPWQRSLRWELEPVRDRRLLWIGGLVALAITVVEIVGFGLGMRNWHVRPEKPQAIRVELIDPVSEPPPAPPEPEPPIVARASRVKVELPQVRQTPPPLNTASDDDAMHARMGEGGSGTPHLFNPDGSVRLGDAPLRMPDKPKTERAAASARWAQIEATINPLDCRKTRFAGAFAPDVSLGDKVAGKYLKWVGLADPEAIRHRAEKRADSGGCEPAK